MQTVKLVIPGEYYDSQIYNGKLYLWSASGSIQIINWENLVEYLIADKFPEHLKFVANCSLQDSDFLYRYEWQLLWQDKKMRELLLARFKELAALPITITPKELRIFTVDELNNPFSFPHTDTLFYYNTLYVGSQNGVHSAKYSRSRRPEIIKLWDGPVLSMAAKYSTLALAAGDEGLFEYKLIFEKISEENIRKTSSKKANMVRWVYGSLFCGSYSTGGYLADYHTRQYKDKNTQKRETSRKLLNVISSSELFNRQMSVQYSWGVYDKLCSASQETTQLF